MSKRGQAVFLYVIMLGLLGFVLGIALAPALSGVVTGNNVMNSSQLDCYNSSITNQAKGVCTQLDTFPPIYLGIIFGLVGMAIGGVFGR